MTDSLKIIIGDDHPFVLGGLEAFLSGHKHRILFAGQNGIEVYNQIALLNPDVAILDIEMPGMTGFEVAEKMQHAGLNTRVVFLTFHKEKPFIYKARQLGVKGYLLKEYAQTEVLHCLDEIMHGKQFYSNELVTELPELLHGDEETENALSASEIKILKLIAAGQATQTIADSLFISPRTVEKHRSNIIKKLGLPNKPNVLNLWAAQNPGGVDGMVF